MRDGEVVGGRFRLDRQIGQGGFARVFLATDLTLERQVALKLLHAELLARHDEGDFLARFRREARAVAALDHPNILGIHDYGETANEVYLVMPYIAGGNLHARLAPGRSLTPPTVGQYLRQIASALDYAHARGIVHRDVKPQNVLLASDERALLADFGVAKVLSDTGAQTQTGAIGTISYMAPEQFGGRIAPALDIYALGCVLFQLLAGRVPYTGSTERVIFSHLHEPIPTLAGAGADAKLAIFQPVINRALQKDPAARYATAGALARDYDRLLAGSHEEIVPTLIGPATPHPATPHPATYGAGMSTGEVRQPTGSGPVVTPQSPTLIGVSRPVPTPVGAMHPTIVSNTTPPPAARRARRPVFVTGGVLLLLVLLALGALAVRQSGIGVTPRATVAGQIAVRSETPTLTPAGATARTATVTAVADNPTPSAFIAGVATPRRTATPSGPPLLGETIATFNGHTDHVRGLAWTSDGTTLISGGDDGTVRFWRPDGALVRTISGRTFAVTSVALSPDGANLAVGADGKSNNAQIWRADGTPVATLAGHTDNVTAVAWSPDGRTLATASSDRTVRLWSATGQPLRVLSGHADAVQSVDWSPDGQLLASASWDKTIRIWRLDGTLVTVLTGHTDQVYAVAWSPDGGTIASGSRDKTVRLWRPDGTLLATMAGHSSFVSTVAWSPDGRTLASASFDRTIMLWGATGAPLATLTGHTDAVTALAWRPDGKGLATGSWDKTIRLWR